MITIVKGTAFIFHVKDILYCGVQEQVCIASV